MNMEWTKREGLGTLDARPSPYPLYDTYFVLPVVPEMISHRKLFHYLEKRVYQCVEEWRPS